MIYTSTRDSRVLTLCPDEGVAMLIALAASILRTTLLSSSTYALRSATSSNSCRLRRLLLPMPNTFLFPFSPPTPTIRPPCISLSRAAYKTTPVNSGSLLYFSYKWTYTSTSVKLLLPNTKKHNYFANTNIMMFERDKKNILQTHIIIYNPLTNSLWWLINIGSIF